MDNNQENLATIYVTEGEDKGRIENKDKAQDIATSGKGEQGSREREAALEREANLGLTAEQEKCRDVFDAVIKETKEKITKAVPDFNINSVVKLDKNGEKYMSLVVVFNDSHEILTVSCILLSEKSEPQLFQLPVNPFYLEQAKTTLENIKPGFSTKDGPDNNKLEFRVPGSYGLVSMHAEKKLEGSDIPGVGGGMFVSSSFNYAELTWDSPEDRKGIKEVLSEYVGGIINEETHKPKQVSVQEIVKDLF